MSVLIKGMEMPENCKKCRCSWYDFTRLFCEADGKPWGLEVTEYADKRHPDCPIIEIPPHGRLIDADALLADVRAHSESYFADDFAHEWVDVAPTVIEAESYSELELQRDYEASVEYAQHCGRYEPTYGPDTGAM